MTSVFISYRRVDSEDVTGRIYEHLTKEIDADGVFKDVDDIPYGARFRQKIREAIDAADIMLVIIGSDWLSVTNDDGGRRIDSASDCVRFEIETALSADIRVIPVLVKNAKMPQAEELPESIRALADCNAAQVRQDPDFGIDMDRLLSSITGRPVRYTKQSTFFQKRNVIPGALVAIVAIVVLTTLGVRGLKEDVDPPPMTPSPRPESEPTVEQKKELTKEQKNELTDLLHAISSLEADKDFLTQLMDFRANPSAENWENENSGLKSQFQSIKSNCEKTLVYLQKLGPEFTAEKWDDYKKLEGTIAKKKKLAIELSDWEFNTDQTKIDEMLNKAEELRNLRSEIDESAQAVRDYMGFGSN